jgi:predicted nucleotidyltransferase component of viral defense system
MALDPTLFADIADARGIAHPAIVEKDYYTIQLLKLLSTLDTSDYTMVFAGGTCLAKAHQNIYRMSEDIDINIIPNEKTQQKSRTEQRRLRRGLNQQIVDAISASETFDLLTKPHLRNEYRFQKFLLEYPTHHENIDALRPHVQLELTESILLQEPRRVSLSSFYAEDLEQENEIDRFPCIELETITAEKFVSLLRRTAAFRRDSNKNDDPTLIRHAYDIHVINEGRLDLDRTKSLVKQVIELDIDKFGNQHPEFRENPINELLLGFDTLRQDPNSRKRYDAFIGPLVYDPNPASWQTALESLNTLVEHILKNGQSFARERT